MSYGENGGMSPADYAAITGGGNNNRGNGMFGDDLLALIILFAVFGGGFGFGGGRMGAGGVCGGGSCATPYDVRAAVDQQTLISKLDNAVYGLSDVAYALNNTVTNGFHNTTVGMMNGFNALQAALCDLGSRFDKCCCETQRSIDGVNYNMSQNFCNLGNLIQNNTRDVIESNNCGNRAILEKLNQMEYNRLEERYQSVMAENQALRFAASQSAQNAFITANQEAQTAELIRRLGRDCPVPAYVVPNPNCCYGNPVGVGYNGGCASGF
jgi:hypothetical protein